MGNRYIISGVTLGILIGLVKAKENDRALEILMNIFDGEADDRT
jgi:hypothetical protein